MEEFDLTLDLQQLGTLFDFVPEGSTNGHWARIFHCLYSACAAADEGGRIDNADWGKISAADQQGEIDAIPAGALTTRFFPGIPLRVGATVSIVTCRAADGPLVAPFFAAVAVNWWTPSARAEIGVMDQLPPLSSLPRSESERA